MYNNAILSLNQHSAAKISYYRSIHRLLYVTAKPYIDTSSFIREMPYNEQTVIEVKSTL